MTEKNLNTRITHKYDTLENWQKATNFVPLQGELIIVAGDNEHSEPRIKVGDGSTKVNQLNYFYEGTTLFDLELICKNKVPTSINADGTIYNRIGYKDGYRVRSAGGEAETTWGSCTGFIAVKAGDIVRISGCQFSKAANENAINVADRSFNNLGQFTMLGAQYDLFTQEAYKNYSYSSVIEESTGVWKWTVPPTESGIAYIRVTGYTISEGHKLLVTINDTIGA